MIAISSLLTGCTGKNNQAFCIDYHTPLFSDKEFVALEQGTRDILVENDIAKENDCK